MRTIQLSHNHIKILTFKVKDSNSKTIGNSTYREVHVVELVDEGFHPGFILFVDWFVHLKHGRQKIINWRHLKH